MMTNMAHSRIKPPAMVSNLYKNLKSGMFDARSHSFVTDLKSKDFKLTRTL